MTATRLLALAACLALGALLIWQRWDSDMPWHSDLESAECCLDVVHAGGLWEGRAYTNGEATTRASAAEGRTLIELDFLVTADGALVTAHDWDALGGAALPLAEVMARTDPAPFDMPRLLAFLEDCPDCRIVTDTKDPFDAFLVRLAEEVPADLLRERFVLQVYSPAEGRAVAERLPGQPILFTAYKMREIPDETLAEIVALPDLAAVTMPLGRMGALAGRVRDMAPDLPRLAHGPPGVIDRPTTHVKGRRAGITGFYIDARP